MPLFEFRCSQCGHLFEALVRRDETMPCPECASRALERLISAPAGHVAGSAGSLPMMSSCPPSNAPPCGPGCCRLPGM